MLQATNPLSALRCRQTVGISNLMVLVEFLNKAEATAKTMDIIDAELAGRPAASIEPKGALPCLLTATQAKLPNFAAHCTSMVTAAPLLVHSSELEDCGKDTIVVYMKAMQGRMLRVKQLIELCMKEPGHDDLLAKALAELT